MINPPSVVASVSVALSSIPNSSCHSAWLAFSISQQAKSLALAHQVTLPSLLGDERVRFTMAGYPGGEPINLAISCEC